MQFIKHKAIFINYFYWYEYHSASYYNPLDYKN